MTTGSPQAFVTGGVRIDAVPLDEAVDLLLAPGSTHAVHLCNAYTVALASREGVNWPTVWAAIRGHGRCKLEGVDHVVRAQVGFDETVMSPAKRHRRGRFITAAVDLCDGRLIDVFEGRNTNDLQAWLGSQPADWVSAIEAVSVDPHEGYRSAVTRSEPPRVAWGPSCTPRLKYPDRAIPGAYQRPPSRSLGRRTCYSDGPQMLSTSAFDVGFIWTG